MPNHSTERTSLIQAKIPDTLNARFTALCKAQRKSKTEVLIDLLNAFCDGETRFETRAENYERRLATLESELAQVKLSLPAAPGTPAETAPAPVELPNGVVRAKTRKNGRTDYEKRDRGKWQRLTRADFEALDKAQFRAIQRDNETLFFPK